MEGRQDGRGPGRAWESDGRAANMKPHPPIQLEHTRTPPRLHQHPHTHTPTHPHTPCSPLSPYPTTLLPPCSSRQWDGPWAGQLLSGSPVSETRPESSRSHWSSCWGESRPSCAVHRTHKHKHKRKHKHTQRTAHSTRIAQRRLSNIDPPPVPCTTHHPLHHTSSCDSPVRKARDTDAALPRRSLP